MVLIYCHFKTICNDVNISELYTLTSKKVFKFNKICIASLLVQQSSGFLIVDIGLFLIIHNYIIPRKENIIKINIY